MADPVLDQLRLARTEGVGPVTYGRLMARFGNAADALAALPALARAGGRASPLVIASAGAAQRERDALTRLGGRLVFVGEAIYPPMMALLADPPPLLSVLGDITALHDRAIGMVGARNASANGRKLAETLAGDLAGQALVIVSGMARGIDAAAHEGALQRGRTVAAVAGGLDHPYPREHATLQARIAAQGAVITEAPLGTAPQSRHFPRRNRLIAGLSLGLVVVEAARQSGSLITARLAQEADRELFAVPGSPLDSRCLGSNDLIRQGAHLTENAADVLANLPDDPRRTGLARIPLFARPEEGFAEPAPIPPPDPDIDLNRVQRVILELLGATPTDIEELIARSGMPASAIMAALTQLELALRVAYVPGNRVVRTG